MPEAVETNPWKKSKVLCFISYTLLVVGLSIIIFTRVYHLTINPHLTEAQALLLYGPLWLAGGGALLAGYVVRNTIGKKSR